MVGGTVVEVNGDYDHIEVIAEDNGEKLAIKVQVTEDSRDIWEGDKIWWQGKIAYWTPKSLKGYREDIEIPRIGYSYKPQEGFDPDSVITKHDLESKGDAPDWIKSLPILSV